MKKLCLIFVGTVVMSGCSKPALECSNDSAQESVIAIVRTQIEKSVQDHVGDEENGTRVSLSKVRAALSQLSITMDEIRTSKEDPNSTKRFCVGSLKVRIPSEILEDADKTREAADLPSLTELAENSDVERNADSFSAQIEFNVQPTDDGSKVFAETESGNNMFDFTGELLASSLLKAAVADAQRQSRLAEQRLAAAQHESRAADLELAKSDNKIAFQTINAAWGAIGADTKKQLLPSQRAWVRKKDADCRLEAAQASLDPTEVEMARLACDTRMTDERISWLQQVHSSEPKSRYRNTPPSTEALDDAEDF